MPFVSDALDTPADMAWLVSSLHGTVPCSHRDEGAACRAAGAAQGRAEKEESYILLLKQRRPRGP